MVVLSVDLIEESFETRWYGLAQREPFLTMNRGKKREGKRKMQPFVLC